MWPNLLEYGWLKVSFFGLYLFTAGVWMSFMMWRRLRLDVPEADIFSLAINTAIGLFLGNMAGSLVDTGSWFNVSGWGMVIGGVWAVWRWCQDLKVDFWELSDWAGLSGLWFWFFGAVFYGPQAKYAGVFALAAIVVASLVKLNYRKFRWYRSGKVGIVGLTAIMAYSIYEIVMGVLFPVRVYWWGMTLGQTVFAWVFAMCAVVVYTRGGNRFRI